MSFDTYRDPRGGKGIHLQLVADGAWPDLQKRHFDRAVEISVVALKDGTQDHHASLAMRFETKHGRLVIGEMTLRELHSIHTSIVAAYGEDWMKPNYADNEIRLGFALQELIAQLMVARASLGLDAVIDMTASDLAYAQFLANRAAGS